MVGQRVFLYVSERLRQIKQSGTALFGQPVYWWEKCEEYLMELNVAYKILE
jgi:hypothetical protein